MLAIGNKHERRPLVYFIGLSAKPNREHLDSMTRTGSIIGLILDRLPNVAAVRTNLVKNPPTDELGRLRYPTAEEMQSGWDELEADMIRIHPSLVVALGLQVSSFLRLQVGIHPTKPRLPLDMSSKSYLAECRGGILSVHHPSFIYVYRRTQIDKYVNNVAASIKSLVI
ncbi:MAG: hypothetical protein A2147_07040 [Chloroflexi bacterium RBG_16_57_8]|nr:MAG: hypothetical protein A2147_07040 [Chloroflexi bacterium RBG_16_57_8]